MHISGCLLAAGVCLLSLPVALGICPPPDRVMISGWFQFGRSCIGISHRIRMNFQEATFFCGRYGGALYALDSPSKNKIMLSYLTTVFGMGRRQKFWTGYYKLENALGWRWSTGSTSRYTDWEPGKPATTNEAIGAVAWGGTYHWSDTWQDEPLSSSFAFICQAPALQPNGQPFPQPTEPPMNPAPGPNTPISPVMPGTGPISPVNPGPGARPGPNMPGVGPINPGTGPVNPGNRPMNPNAGPTNPNAGPINPNAGPTNPNTGPTNPNAGPVNPGGRPANPRPANPRAPAVLQRIRGYAPHAQRMIAIP